MKKSLADKIEQYLKVLIERSENNEIEIQRAELAETFACVPSQITYVIGTRFNETVGYYTESRRGGKGFVRINRIDNVQVKAGISRKDFFSFIDDLLDLQLITENESRLLKHLAVNGFREIPLETQNQLFLKLKTCLENFVHLP
ncbi:MAG TPA: CtsR family transcriptional regulator [Syntrophomonadaceae bacterium]|nr:CtsR family transcriptional regulator [Syntrophomonadaceae bacterium]HPR93488.1 CtsR family transcriptional regulator [Syntrophomonadaceae bacterium]